MVRTINSYQEDSNQLLKDLETKCLQTEKNCHPPLYTGQPNEALDRPFQLYELRAAITESKRNSAPGPDHISYKQLANLEDQALETLVEYFNNFWTRGDPTAVENSRDKIYPKPEKSPHIDNLRPISLTSCVGKVMERVILKGHLH